MTGNTQQSDLTYLIQMVLQSFQQLSALLAKGLKENSPLATKAKKRLAQTSELILKLKKYSKHLAVYTERCEKEKERTQQQLAKTKNEFLAIQERVLCLQIQSMELRKNLNQKDREIQELKLLNKLNVSFAESIDFCEEEQDEIILETQNSLDSLQMMEQLEFYNSATGVHGSGMKEKTQSREQREIQAQIQRVQDPRKSEEGAKGGNN